MILVIVAEAAFHAITLMSARKGNSISRPPERLSYTAVRRLLTREFSPPPGVTGMAKPLPISS